VRICFFSYILAIVRQHYTLA